MKILIASDIHGSAYWAKQLMNAIEKEQPHKVVLLGDILYHGPRNNLPKGYNPKEVIPLLNSLAKTGNLIAVRGNCDAEVDQMVLDFPCMADFSQLIDDKGRTLFLTHGHIYGPGLHGSADNLPTLPNSSVVCYGHTHVKVNKPFYAGANREMLAYINNVESKGAAKEVASEQSANNCEQIDKYQDSNLWLFNPGSLSLPKDGSHGYGIYDSELPIEEAFRHVVIGEC